MRRTMLVAESVIKKGIGPRTKARGPEPAPAPLRLADFTALEIELEGLLAHLHMTYPHVILVT
jgi:hypothetical protein